MSWFSRSAELVGSVFFITDEGLTKKLMKQANAATQPRRAATAANQETSVRCREADL